MEVKIIIPNNDNDGSDNAGVIESAIRNFCQLFGGATAWQAKGFWVNDDGKLFEDAVTVIVSVATADKEAKSALADLATSVLDATDQEAVFISVDGDAEIIPR